MNRTMLKKWLFLTPGRAWLPVILVFAGLIAVVYLESPEADRKAEAAPVPAFETLLAEPQQVRLDLHSQGIARARHRVPLTLRASGEIVALDPAFENGGWVEAGQTLVKLDPEPFLLEIAQYEHQVAAARLHLAEVRANASVARRNASANATALALYKPQVSEAESRLAAAEASLEMAQRRLRQSSLEAPFNGRLEKVAVSPGQQVRGGETLAVLYSAADVEVRLPIRDDWLQLLDTDLGTPHRPLAIPVALRGSFAGREHVWNATITRREGGLNRNQMTWLIAEVDIHAGELPLEPGVFVKAEIQGGRLDNVYVLPRDALLGKSDVWVLASGEILRRRPVEWTYRDAEFVYVTAGLNPGDRVLKQGHRHLLEGTRARPAPVPLPVPAPEQPPAANPEAIVTARDPS